MKIKLTLSVDPEPAAFAHAEVKRTGTYLKLASAALSSAAAA